MIYRMGEFNRIINPNVQGGEFNIDVTTTGRCFFHRFLFRTTCYTLQSSSTTCKHCLRLLFLVLILLCSIEYQKMNLTFAKIPVHTFSASIVFPSRRKTKRNIVTTVLLLVQVIHLVILSKYCSTRRITLKWKSSSSTQHIFLNNH